MPFSCKKIPLSITSIITLSALSLLALTAQAQQPAESTSVIPYQGTLFSQGKPVSQTDPIKMAFALYSDRAALDSDTTHGAPPEGREWTSWEMTAGVAAQVTGGQTVDVQVRNGRFLVRLGDTETNQRAISDPIFTPGQLYVVAWVVQSLADQSERVFRLPPQVLGAVPFAVMAHNGAPVGSIMAFAGSAVPAGWLLCNGDTVSASAYPHLFEAIGTTWGGDATNFQLPDLRGQFLRGLDAGRGVDPDDGRTLGSEQIDQFKSHEHNIHRRNRSNRGIGLASVDFPPSGGNALYTYYRYNTTSDNPYILPQDQDALFASPSGGVETRPKNVAVHYIIKY